MFSLLHHLWSCLWWQHRTWVRVKTAHTDVALRHLCQLGLDCKGTGEWAFCFSASQLFREHSSVSKLSSSGQGFSLTSFEKWTAGWIHKKAVCWTICLLTGGNIGNHQRVGSGERHSRAWGGTCGPFFLVICPGWGGATWATIWPRTGN